MKESWGWEGPISHRHLPRPDNGVGAGEVKVVGHLVGGATVERGEGRNGAGGGVGWVGGWVGGRGIAKKGLEVRE